MCELTEVDLRLFKDTQGHEILHAVDLSEQVEVSTNEQGAIKVSFTRNGDSKQVELSNFENEAAVKTWESKINETI